MFDAIYSLFRGAQTPMQYLPGDWMHQGNKKNLNFQSLLEEQSLSTRDVGRFIGLLLETVRNRYPFQPLRLILYIYIYIRVYPENLRIA